MSRSGAQRGPAVVSGAGSGIGRAIALALAGRGHAVAGCGRRQEPLDALAAELDGASRMRAADVRRPAEMSAFAEEVVEALGVPEVVVAAAGVARVGPFLETPPEALEESLATNLAGVANLFRAFLPAMVGRGAGTLVTLSSVAARRVFPGWSAYCASKWGLAGWVEALREELAGTGVRLLTVTPGATASPLWEEVPGEWDPNRMIPAAEVARAVLWGLDGGDGVAVEEIRLQPPGGNL